MMIHRQLITIYLSEIRYNQWRHTASGLGGMGNCQGNNHQTEVHGQEVWYFEKYTGAISKNIMAVPAETCKQII